MIKDLTLEGPQEVPGRAGPATKYPSRLGVLHFMESQEFYRKGELVKETFHITKFQIKLTAKSLAPGK